MTTAAEAFTPEAQTTPGAPSIDGLVYLLNQAGEALSEANKRILAYSQENTILRQVIEAMRSPEQIKTAEELVDEDVPHETDLVL